MYNQSPVNQAFFGTTQARSLVRLQEGPNGQTEYAPYDGQGPFGPVVPMTDFAEKHFSTKNGEDQDAVMLCDPGTDDIIAGILALDKTSPFNLKMIIPSKGNVGAEQTFQNTLKLISLTKAFGVSVAKGSSTFLTPEVNAEDASAEHGEDGLNGAAARNPDDLEKDKKSIKVFDNGVELLTKEIIRRHDNDEPPLTIINTGTMTDLALVLQALETERPEEVHQIIRKIKGISLMGGGIDRYPKEVDGQTKGWHTNFTEHAEFNLAKDPIAGKIGFDLIQKYRIPTMVFPLDLTHQTGVRDNYEGEWQRQHPGFEQNDVAHLAQQVFHAGKFDIDRSREIYGFPPEHTTRFMHDADTITGVTHPHMYGGFMGSIDVVTEGEEAGRTIVKSDPNSSIFINVQADAPAIVNNWQTTIANFKLKESVAGQSLG